jgi:hypothetical protein
MEDPSSESESHSRSKGFEGAAVGKSGPGSLSKSIKESVLLAMATKKRKSIFGQDLAKQKQDSIGQLHMKNSRKMRITFCSIQVVPIRSYIDKMKARKDRISIGRLANR